MVIEENTDSVRAIPGCHLYEELCSSLVRLPLLVNFAREVLQDDVYVYQFKVNGKHARVGARWPWHQDFAFWNQEDGMQHANAVNISIHLDGVHDANGPLKVISGSHAMGLFDLPDDSAPRDGWEKHVSSDPTYTVSDERVEKLKGELGEATILGAAGSVFSFPPSIVHASTDNRSADRRMMLLLTYNAVSNAPCASRRPEFLVSRDASLISPLETDWLPV